MNAAFPSLGYDSHCKKEEKCTPDSPKNRMATGFSGIFRCDRNDEQNCNLPQVPIIPGFSQISSALYIAKKSRILRHFRHYTTCDRNDEQSALMLHKNLQVLPLSCTLIQRKRYGDSRKSLCYNRYQQTNKRILVYR